MSSFVDVCFDADRFGVRERVQRLDTETSNRGVEVASLLKCILESLLQVVWIVGILVARKRVRDLCQFGRAQCSSPVYFEFLDKDFVGEHGGLITTRLREDKHGESSKKKKREGTDPANHGASLNKKKTRAGARVDVSVELVSRDVLMLDGRRLYHSCRSCRRRCSRCDGE